MSSYVDIQDSLKKLSKKRGKFECKDNKYDLSCVIYHHGYAFSSGHYTAAVRNSIDEKWRLFNDTYVSERHKEEISKSDCSYMLFYQRRPSVPWFPQNVPENIIEKYQGEKEKDERDYKQFNDQDSTKRRNDNDSRRNDKNTTKQPWLLRFLAPKSYQNIEGDYNDPMT
uniref:ubiquitinyl hydrolase 1 n=1 Tax=Meloidogyne incognita TaxID=6306 RepID=A0A914N690_MELIC